MDQNAFAPPAIVDLAEVAMLLGFHPLAQLLIDAAYAVANEEVKFDKIETAFKDLSCALLLIRGPEAGEDRSESLWSGVGLLFSPNAAHGTMAEAERSIRWEMMAARQTIF
jgi:hypothetical protein